MKSLYCIFLLKAEKLIIINSGRTKNVKKKDLFRFNIKIKNKKIKNKPSEVLSPLNIIVVIPTIYKIIDNKILFFNSLNIKNNTITNGHILIKKLPSTILSLKKPEILSDWTNSNPRILWTNINW